MTLICQPCGNEVEPATKYFAIIKTPQGFELRVYCEHSAEQPPPNAIILASGNCAVHWFIEFMMSLKRCVHEQAQQSAFRN